MSWSSPVLFLDRFHAEKNLRTMLSRNDSLQDAYHMQCSYESRLGWKEIFTGGRKGIDETIDRFC